MQKRHYLMLTFGEFRRNPQTANRQSSKIKHLNVYFEGYLSTSLKEDIMEAK